MSAPAIHEWPGGRSWLAHPEESMQRASHALVDGDDVWLVDPLDADGIDATIEDLGEVAGVVVLLDRHTRDAEAFADRYGVAVHLPGILADVGEKLGAPVERFDGELGRTGYRVRPIIDNRLWREAALVGADGETLVVPEALGTNPYFRAPGERVGVHPALRLLPPRRQLSGLAPGRLLVGHGAPLRSGAAPAIRDALRGSRRRAPAAYLRMLRALVGR